MKVLNKLWHRQMMLLVVSIIILGSCAMHLQAEEQQVQIVSFLSPAMQEVVVREKESLQEILEKLPKTLEALDEKNELVEIPVQWECVGDYEETSYYYYQFVPVIDAERYVISEKMELPYIWILISPSENLSRGVTSSANETKIYNFLRNDLKCNMATALGILANIERESTFNPKAGSSSGYYGICQWGSTRLDDLKKYCENKKIAYDSLDGQLAFLKHELYGTESRAWSKMQGIENTQEGAYLAGYNWARYFERCSPVYYEVSAKRARDVYWPKYYKEISVERIFGADRYKTSFLIADCLKNVLGIEKFDNMIIATGKGFADALSGSYLANRKNAPILLTNGKNIAALLQYVEKNLQKGGMVYILGGENAVSAEVEGALNSYKVKRLFGATRYETNIQILKEAGLNTKELVVCTGKKFADSLSASASGRPIFLVSDSLNSSQEKYLEGLKFDKIYIVGGESAVNTNLKNILANYGTISRIAGDTRYETSVMAAETLVPNAKKVVLTYSKNFPDGLCGGPLAAALNAPLVLTMTTEITAADKYIQTDKITSGYVLGGEKLISDDAVRTIFELNASDTIKIYGN